MTFEDLKTSALVIYTIAPFATSRLEVIPHEIKIEPKPEAHNVHNNTRGSKRTKTSHQSTPEPHFKMTWA